MRNSMEEEARNETIFRDMNEWTEEATDGEPVRFAIPRTHGPTLWRKERPVSYPMVLVRWREGRRSTG